MTSDDEWEGGITIPPKNDDVIYEQPLILFYGVSPCYFVSPCYGVSSCCAHRLCYGVSGVMVLAHVMVLADVIVLIYIWLDDYLTVESHCIFSNKTYHHVETLQCLK